MSASARARAPFALTLALMLGSAACDRASPSPTTTAPSAPSASAAPGAGDAAAPAAVGTGEARATTLLGGERGLDHVGIAVGSLEEATRIYHDVLGFNRPTEGKLPNGIRNVNYYFADSTYLETMVHWDRTRAKWLADFTDKHSGALFAVLAAYSPDATRTYLATRGIALGQVYSGTIQTGGEDAMPDEKWKTFFLPEGQLPGNPIYFIAYPRASREDFLRKLEDRGVRKIFHHDNTVLGIRAAWLAVPDLAAATKAYEAIGLTRGRAFKDPALGADGQVFEAGAGEIWLLAPSAAPTALDGGSSKVTEFLRERGGPGVMGVTLSAGSVPAAARLLAERTGRPMPTYEGQLGNSIRLSPDLTLGVWMELAQHLVPANRQGPPLH